MSSKECGLGGKKLLTKPWKLLLFPSAVPKATHKTPALRSMADLASDSPGLWLSTRVAFPSVPKPDIGQEAEGGDAPWTGESTVKGLWNEKIKVRWRNWTEEIDRYDFLIFHLRIW